MFLVCSPKWRKVVKLKYALIAEGPGPSEAVVAIRKADGGNEQMIVHEPSVTKENGIDVAGAIAREDNRVLVELPRESLAGNWRVWVPAEDLSA
jgi:hypothetical protein